MLMANLKLICLIEAEIYQEEAKPTSNTDHIVLFNFYLYIIFIEYFFRLCLV